MARKIIIITGVVWGFLFLVGLGCNRPALGLFPLCGLYPGGFASGDPGYNPRFITLWCILLGIIFSALGFIALRYRSVAAAGGFLALFLISGGSFIVRVAAVFNELH